MVIGLFFDDMGNLNGFCYGLMDELMRFNFNVLLFVDEVFLNGGWMLLLFFFGMSEEIVDVILDWLDEDDDF